MNRLATPAAIVSLEANEGRSNVSSLIVLGFQDEADAFQMRAHLTKMQKQYLIEMEDAVVVTRDSYGRVNLHQAVSLPALGAVQGTFWGMLIGLIFLNPLFGAAVGAGAGALSGALSDIGIDDGFMRELGTHLQPGTSALFVLSRNAPSEKVLEGLRPYMGKATIIQTSLTKTEEADLRVVLEGLPPSASPFRQAE